MESWNLKIFLVPSIALLLVTLFYFYFVKKVEHHQHFKSFFWKVAFLAYFFNLVWEIAQGFLYQGYVYDFQHISFCALASVADVFMVLLIYFGFALIYRHFFWIEPLTFTKVLLTVSVGGVGAIFAETRHLAAGNWAYADAMPLLPIVEVGLSPVLQFMLLPILIYWLSFAMVKRKYKF